MNNVYPEIIKETHHKHHREKLDRVNVNKAGG